VQVILLVLIKYLTSWLQVVLAEEEMLEAVEVPEVFVRVNVHLTHMLIVP
jgi:hypothetical protein